MTGTTRIGAAGAQELLARGVVVLHGGRSSEREVSLQSGREILAGLAQGLGRDPRLRGVEVARDGRWVLDGTPREPLDALAALPRETLYFLGLHGGEGENGTLQALLTATGRAFTGSGVAASALCMDKHLTRLALADGGLAVAPGRRVLPEDWGELRADELGAIAALGPGPWFVKPNSGGSSVGTALAADAVALEAAVERVLAAGDAALVELRVQGVEATCAVLGNRGEALRTLTPVEIRPRAQGFFDYREKYDAEGAVELCPPERIPPPACARLRERAARAHRLAGCDGYARIDFIVPPDPDAQPVALEINTLPGMTPRSLLPRAAAHDGLDFPSLCVELARLGLAADRERTR